jgi:hypothetical protein
MHIRKLRSLTAGAATFGAVALAATLVLGSGVASASPADPPGGATPVAPHFYNGNVAAIRDSGSDTTFFMMQKIGDLYTGAGLYGCVLNGLAGASATNYNSSDPAQSSSNVASFCAANSNISTTDVNDNWDRTEVSQGVDDVGSGAGQAQLCGSTPSPLTVDFARSSKPAGTACSTLVETGYAKDGIPVVDYPVNPSTYGTSTFSGYDTVNGGNIGPVTSGWLPGDPVGGPYNGSALSDISNIDNGGSTGSTAYRLWCQTSLTGVNPRISDWGQLTNLGPNLEVVNVTTSSGSTNVTVSGSFPASVAAGQSVSGPGIPSGTTVSSVSGGSLTLSASAGANASNATLTFAIGTTLAEGQGVPIGLPIRIMGVNTSSGTEATFASYANSGNANTGCSSSMNPNAANDPNPATAPSPNSAHVALENNSDQINEFAVGDFPSPDFVDQAIEVSTTLYIESNGVLNTNPYAAASTIDGTSYAGNKLTENGGRTPTTPNLLSNAYPTARTLFNIYRSDTVRASTAGFLNWICDGNVNFQKGLDNSTGKNFDTELNGIIGTTFGFPRLTDVSPASAVGTPADNLAAPNNTCSASLPISTTSGSNTITLTAGGNFPPDITNAGSLPSPVNNVTVAGTGIPAGDFVVSGAGTSTLTLNAAATANGSGVNADFLGVPSVTVVGSSQN